MKIRLKQNSVKILTWLENIIGFKTSQNIKGSSHKVAGVRQAIEAVGASLCYLPPYSPDLNPIEKAFAKLKTLRQRAATRTVNTSRERIDSLVDAFSAGECGNDFVASGYEGN